MKKLLLGTLAITVTTLSCSLLNAQSDYSSMPDGLYHLDKTHASLTWKVSHLGLSNYTARFTHFDASLNFDPENIENSSLTATIDPRSLTTDYPRTEKKDFDKTLIISKRWFNATVFPRIRFVSTAITSLNETNVLVTGELTFLGVTKPISLNVTFNGAVAVQPFNGKPTLGFSATGVLQRSEFGLTTYIPNVGDKVTLLIEAEFAKGH